MPRKHRYALVGLCTLPLPARELPNADLHQTLDLGHIAQHVRHYGGMRVLETLVGVPQVAVRVDLQHAERAVTLADGAYQTVGRRVVAADQTDDPALGEPVLRLGEYLAVDLGRSLVYLAHLARVELVGYDAAAALFEVCDHTLGIAPQAVRDILYRVVDRRRGYALAPCVGSCRIVKIDLARHIYYRVGGIRGARPV